MHTDLVDTIEALEAALYRDSIPYTSTAILTRQSCRKIRESLAEALDTFLIGNTEE